MGLVDLTPRPLGPFEVGPVGLGCWRLVPANVADPAGLIEAALDAGCNLIDTADVYGLDWGGTAFGQAEEFLGSALAAQPGLRDRMVLATKGGIRPPTPYDSSPEWIVSAVDDSLRRLGVEVIDCYQIHRPDAFTHPAALAEALDGLVAGGKIRTVGVSNHTVAETRALAAHLEAPIVSTQPEFSIAHLDPMRDGTLHWCHEVDARPLAWSPLGGGRLADGGSDDLSVQMASLAKDRGVSIASIALAFVLAHPSRPVALLGTTKPDRIQAAMNELTRIQLDRSEVYTLVQASDGVPLP